MASVRFAVLRVHQAINTVRPDMAGLRREIRKNDGLARELADASDDASAKRRARALSMAGDDLKKMGQFARAARRLEDAEAIYRGLRERDTAVHVAISRAGALIFLNRWEEAAGVLDRVIDEVGGVGGTFPNVVFADPLGVNTVTNAVGLWLYVLAQLNCSARTSAATDAVIGALDHPATTPGQQSAVAHAFYLKGVVAHANGDLDGALVALAESIQRRAGDQDVSVVVTHARAMVERAAVLADLGRRNEALETCDAVLQQFGSVSDVSTRMAVLDGRKLKRRLTRSRRSAATN